MSDALKTTTGWSPENHIHFSSQLKEQVQTLLLVAKAANWALPDDALFAVFESLCKASFRRE